MSDFDSPPPGDSIDIRQLANAVRSIGKFERIFQDMLGGKPLPFATQLILDQRAIFLAVAVLIPSVALAALLTRRVVMGIYIISAAGLVALIESGVVYQSMVAPL